VALCPTLTILEPRPALVARYAEDLVEAITAVSPLVEAAEQGVVFADMRGTEGLFPRIEDLRRAVFAGVPPRFQPRLGVAGHRLPAYVAAMRADPASAVHVPTDEAASLLGAEPVEVLPLPPEAIEQLQLLGIEVCGQFASLPRHA